ncbi:unnamed protein product [Fraxinus pennsylvanica]|uniref:DUF4283 domain-containing protein n=1 Tax=Fraxinus pennsylvanica TaxID=56036 RepID=A0AAD1ZKS8_9LAMI|nr:unnamed protein product [Fraxinus pennsylvanica]
MARDLSSLYARLRLTEKESQVLEVVEAVDGLSVEKRAKCLAFRVLADPEVNKGALKTIMLQIWQLEGKAVIKEIGRNTFLLELIRVSGKKRILSGRPWSFDEFLLCLHDCERVNTIKEIGFTEEVFWVQCHGLPFAGMTQNTGQAIGEHLGKVLVIDTDSSGVYFGAFLRVKPSEHLTGLEERLVHNQVPDYQQKDFSCNQGELVVGLSGMISVQKFRNWIIVGQIAHVGMFYWTWAMVKIGKKRARSSPVLVRPQLMEVDGFEPIALSTKGQEDVDVEDSSPKRVRRVLSEKDDFGLAVAAG